MLTLYTAGIVLTNGQAFSQEDMQVHAYLDIIE